MFEILSGATRASLVTFLLCGFAYPIAVFGVGHVLTPYRAAGSLVTNSDGVIVGSRLIGQNWTDAKWFHGRPSATTDTDPNDPTKTIPAPYNAASSSASNLGPTSKALQDRLTEDRKAFDSVQPDLAGKRLPADVLTTSGSGLDPDITPANAQLQIERVAKARGVAPDQIAELVARHTTPRSLDIFGEPRVNILELNLDLEKAFPLRESPEAKKTPPVAEATPAPAPAAPVAAAPSPPAAALPASGTPSTPAVESPAASVASEAPAPQPPAAAPPPVIEPGEPSEKPAPTATGVAAAIFPTEISPAHAHEKPDVARAKTCSDQYRANAAAHVNGGLTKNAYLKECKKRLKG
jgi:potassium-transporting ATPase KdpC subunit